MIGRPKLVLASGSPRRLALLNQAGIEPDSLQPTEVDEIPIKGELPRALANRLARAKAQAALASVRINEELRGSYILAADTVVAVGRRVMPKADMLEEAAACLRLLSGRNHRVYTGICLVTPKEAFRQRLVETRVRFKRLSTEDLRSLSRLGRMARQGRRLCDPGARRHVRGQDGRLVHQRGRPAAVREHVAARRRGLSGAFRLAERVICPRPAKRGEGARADGSARTRRPMMDCREPGEGPGPTSP